jgi:hypothetical protein
VAGCGSCYELVAAVDLEVDARYELVSAADLEVDALYELIAAIDLEVDARLQMEQVGGSKLLSAPAGCVRL